MNRLLRAFATLGLALTVTWADPAVAFEGTPLATVDRSFDVHVEGRGPPMLLIPGLQSSGDVWTALVEHYKERYTLHVVTVAGFAGVAPDGEFSIARLRDALLNYIRHERLLPAIVVGHSLGGVTAYAIGAAAGPGELRAIVSVDGLPFLPALMNPAATADSMRSEAKRVEALYASMSPDQLAAQSEMALGRMITSSADRARAVRWARESDARTSGRAVAEAFTTDLRPVVGRIRAPVLVVGAAKFAASNDVQLAGLTRAYAAQLTSIPQHELVMARGALHFVMLDDPAFLTATLDQFLAAHP